MNATVIDTLRLADRLKQVGFQADHAEGMARALGDELGDRVLTRSDLDDAKRDIDSEFGDLEPRFDAIDARFDALEPRFDAIDAKFDALEPRFDAIDAKFDAMDTKFDAMDSKIDAMDAKFDAKFDALDVKIDSVQREVSGKFNVLATVMVLGFTLLAGMIGYTATLHSVGDAGTAATQPQGRP